MNNPIVTILIPAYNAAAFLPKCLETVLNQTYRYLQVVIVDDGSKDDTWAVCQRYASSDNRIEIYHQNNQGVATTRNHLLEKVKGNYVLFVDADDWIEEGMIEFLVNEVQNHDADVSMCRMVVNDTPVSDVYKEEVIAQPEIIKRFLFHDELRGSLCNKLVKASLLQSIKINGEISYGEDALFCWRFLQKTKKMVLTDRQLYHYRMNGASISHQSFGDKKLTGHNTWQIITEETSKKYPQYLPIAQARHCVEDILLYRNAAHSHYPYNDKVKLLKSTIINYRHFLFRVKMASIKIKLYSLIAPYSYWFASKF